MKIEIDIEDKIDNIILVSVQQLINNNRDLIIEKICDRAADSVGMIDGKNMKVRTYAIKNKVSYRAIAKAMGITPEYLSKCMRYQLTENMEKRIMSAINDIVKKSAQENAVVNGL